MIYPRYDDFVTLSKDYDLIPVYTHYLGDTETPITVYQKLVGEGLGCLLESVEGGQYLGRYSFVAYDPLLDFSSENGKGILFFREGGEREADGNPFEVLKELLGGYRFCTMEQLPRFYGGAVGYLAYEALQSSPEQPAIQEEGPAVPDCQMFFPGVVVIFDHLSHQLTIVINCMLNGLSPALAYEKAVAKLEEIRAKLAGTPPTNGGQVQLVDTPKGEITDEEFMARVAQTIAHVKKGAARQVVLSRRFSCRFEGDDFQFYRRLRSINPSPYMFYLNLGEIKAIGSSPEMLVRVEGGKVTTCPIAGTRRRGSTLEEDRHLTEELLNDPKEIAEHEMLLEYAIADLMPVCSANSIQVTAKLEPQYYSHVIHLTSRVEGQLKSGCHPVDALAACFPAGTVSGSPRAKAMKIVEKLEQSRRGIYAGAIGYFGFNEAIDTAIAIRTLVVKDRTIYIQAGAGIVEASEPARELEEVNEKARAMFKALSVDS